jgi:hypothetical protein
MGAWLESYEKLSPEQQERVQLWIHLNKFISRTLRIDWEKWIDDYVNPAMENPLDFSFMQDALPDANFTGLGVEGGGVSFTKDMDPATAQTARVPLRAKNNLGRLSADLQDAIAQLLESAGPAPVAVGPADVAKLQKILPKERPLATLKRKDFRKVTIARDADDIVIAVKDGDELVRTTVLEFGAEMRKAWV